MFGNIIFNLEQLWAQSCARFESFCNRMAMRVLFG